jgi:hypothetical protein
MECDCFLRKIGKGSPKVLALKRATRQPRLNLKANWFRPGDLPEPLDEGHFPPINKTLSSFPAPSPEYLKKQFETGSSELTFEAAVSRKPKFEL